MGERGYKRISKDGSFVQLPLEWAEDMTSTSGTIGPIPTSKGGGGGSTFLNISEAASEVMSTKLDFSTNKRTNT
jgi:hypothetical protein